MVMTEETLDRILESLTRISVTLESMRVTLTSVSETQHDQEQRLRSLERWKHHLTPLIGMLTFLSGVVCSVIVQRSL